MKSFNVYFQSACQHNPAALLFLILKKVTNNDSSLTHTAFSNLFPLMSYTDTVLMSKMITVMGLYYVYLYCGHPRLDPQIQTSLESVEVFLLASVTPCSESVSSVQLHAAFNQT